MTVDRNLRTGDTDDDGDRKLGEAYLRCGTADLTYLVGLRGSISTPQMDERRRQYDTGIFAMTFGAEGRLPDLLPLPLHWGLYGSLGLINGGALRMMYSMTDFSHQMGGMGDARRSDASSGARPLISVAGRLDHSRVLANIYDAGFGLSATTFAVVGSDQVALGGAAYVFLTTEPAAPFRPSLTGLPPMLNGGNAVYAGLNGRLIAFDVTTNRVGTNHAQAAFAVGAQTQLGPVVAGIELSGNLTCEVQGCRSRPVGNARAYLAIRW